MTHLQAGKLLGSGSRRLVLASSSPRRRDLLTMLGLEFEARVPDIDESPPAGMTVCEAAASVAMAKAQRVCASNGDALIIAADTVVLINGRVLGKPADAGEARQMLHLLSGNSHTVVTGVAVVDEATRRAASAWEETLVQFASMTSGEIDALVATGDGLDKAGSYGIQSIGALAVARIEGDYFNVVGLPLQLMRALIKKVVQLSERDEAI